LGEVDFAAMRAAMVASQLRTSDVNDEAVIAAMSHVAREDFVPAVRRDTAYVDRAIPLGAGRTMNPPLVTGRLLTVAHVRAGDKALLLGDTTGYSAALLQHMGAQVTVVSDIARPRAVHADVKWSKGVAAKGQSKGAPYDVLIIDGAVTKLPDVVLRQLADNGRIAMGLLDRGVSRLSSGRRAGDTAGFISHADMDMAMAPGFEAKAAEFVF